MGFIYDKSNISLKKLVFGKRGDGILMENDDALEALKKDVPFFVRPAVRRRVESMAADENRSSIDLSFYQQAKANMGPK